MPLHAINSTQQRIVNRMKKHGVKHLADSELQRTLTASLLPIAKCWRREDYKGMLNQINN